MPNDALQQTYNSYLDAYNDIAPNERERLLRLSVSDDIVSTNPNGESHGLESLMDHIAQFQKEKPGASFKSKKLLAHHGHFLSEWTMF